MGKYLGINIRILGHPAAPEQRVTHTVGIDLCGIKLDCKCEPGMIEI